MAKIAKYNHLTRPQRPKQPYTTLRSRQQPYMTKATTKRCPQGNTRKRQYSNRDGIQIPTDVVSQPRSWATSATYRCFQDHWIPPICDAKLNHWIQASIINGFKVRPWIHPWGGQWSHMLEPHHIGWQFSAPVPATTMGKNSSDGDPSLW